MREMEFIRKYLLTGLLTALLLLVSIGAAHAQQPRVKILPLGDSISAASKYKVSYRYPLWQKLVDAGYNVEFVGSQTTEGKIVRSWDAYKGKPFPSANEAHSGFRTDQVLNGIPKYTVGLNGWIRKYVPDIALIHLGTNDLYQKQTPESTRDELQGIVLKLRQRNPRIKVLLAQIVPLPTKHSTQVPRYNQLVAQLARKLDQPNSPVMAVDMFTGYSIATDMYAHDPIHPSPAGEQKLADRWFKALMNPRYLGAQ